MIRAPSLSLTGAALVFSAALAGCATGPDLAVSARPFAGRTVVVTGASSGFGRGVALAKRALAQADIDAGRLVAPLADATAVDFAYSLVFPKPKGRLRQVRAFAAWMEAEARAHEAALLTQDNGAGI